MYQTTLFASSAADEHSADTELLTVDLLGAAVQGMRIVHHNIQSIHSKLTELTQWFDICENTATIFETWLQPCSPRVVVPGYTMLTSPILCHPDKPTSYLPGSRIIASNFVSIERPPVCENVENSCQLLDLVCVLLIVIQVLRCVVSVYRSPSTDLIQGLVELQSVFSELLLHCQHIVIAGDSNVDLLTQSSTSSVYTEFLTDYHLVQHVLDPTRITSTSATLIDHIFTTPCVAVHSVYQSVGLSNHMLQFADVDLTVTHPKPTVISVRSFHKCDWAAVRESLVSVPWQVMTTLMS